MHPVAGALAMKLLRDPATRCLWFICQIFHATEHFNRHCFVLENNSALYLIDCYECTTVINGGQRGCNQSTKTVIFWYDYCKTFDLTERRNCVTKKNGHLYCANCCAYEHQANNAESVNNISNEDNWLKRNEKCTFDKCIGHFPYNAGK